jgi:hypothetical protein
MCQAALSFGAIQTGLGSHFLELKGQYSQSMRQIVFHVQQRRIQAHLDLAYSVLFHLLGGRRYEKDVERGLGFFWSAGRSYRKLSRGRVDGNLL